MNTKQLNMRGFHIVNHSGAVDAVAQFMYKDYMISMSTMGLSKGACQTEVEIYHRDNLNKPATDRGFHTVEEAIEQINGLNDLLPKQARDQIVGLCELLVKSNIILADQADDIKKRHGIIGENNG